MNAREPIWRDHERYRLERFDAKLYLRHDAARYLRHDAHRFMPPSAHDDGGNRPNVVAWTGKRGRWMPEDFSVDATEQPRREAASELHALLDLKANIVKLRSDLAFERFKRAYYRWVEAERLRRKAGFRADQPRVPSGNPGGGQWTSEGEKPRLRLVADKPPIGPIGGLIFALEAAKLAIDVYRSREGLWDLFHNPQGAVTTTKFNGEDIFGSNSNSPTYRRIDHIEATNLRDRFLVATPDLAARGNAGFKPNDGFYHAETNVLLRAARANGGTLAGQTLEVFGDTKMCSSCREVLPFVGIQLGNPIVTFVEPSGKTRTMRDGVWIKEGQQ